MTEAERERAAVVAWLLAMQERKADLGESCANEGDYHGAAAHHDEAVLLGILSRLIERGEHLQQEN